MNDMPTPTTPDTVQPQWTEHLRDEVKAEEVKIEDEIKKMEAAIKEDLEKLDGKSDK